MAPPGELVRVVHVPGGGLAVDRTGAGRGAWLCAGSPACFEQAARRRVFGRALRTEIGAEAVNALRASFIDRARMERRVGDTRNEGKD